MRNGQIEFRKRSEPCFVPMGNGMETDGVAYILEYRQWFDGDWSGWAVIDRQEFAVSNHRSVDTGFFR